MRGSGGAATESAVALSYISASQDRMYACMSWACCGVAVNPVPIAHTGSYAMITLLISSLVTPASPCHMCSMQHTASQMPSIQHTVIQRMSHPRSRCSLPPPTVSQQRLSHQRTLVTTTKTSITVSHTMRLAACLPRNPTVSLPL